MKKYLTTVLLAALLSTWAFSSHAQIKIKFIVVNPSDKEKQLVPVKYYLPPEIKPEDVVDAGGLSIDYDVDQNNYYVSGQAELGPKETKVYTIDVKDVWKVSDEKLKLMKEHLDEKLVALEGSTAFEKAKGLTTNIIKRITDIEESQSGSKPVAERVEAYRINNLRVDAIDNDMIVLDQMITGEVVEDKIVTIKVELNNPYQKKYEFPVSYLMPPELRESDVVDPAGFGVSYDAENMRVILKGKVELDPGQSMKYEVKVKDVWYIKPVELDAVQDESGKIASQLVDTDFEKLGNYLLGEITALIKQIQETQKADLPLKSRIAAYKENMKRFELAKKYLDRLRSFMLQFDLARSGQEGIPDQKNKKTEVTFGGGQSEGKGGGVGEGMGSALGKGRGQSTQQRGGGIQGIRGLKGIILVSQSIFRGWKPEIATTWFIILGIIAFLFIFAFLFFIVWIILSAREKKLETLKRSTEKEAPKEKKK